MLDFTSSLTNTLQSLKPTNRHQLFWWVVIHTTIPKCTYYFGPFTTAKEAHLSQYGYLEDLMEEKAHGISVRIKQCRQPASLTIEE